MPLPTHIKISAVAATDPDAVILISELTTELAGLYEHAQDGSGDFRIHEQLPKSVFLGGYHRGQAVACGAIRPLTPDVAEVKRMYVRTGFRGRGFSKQILSALELAAIDFGYVAVRLETGDRQLAAIRLYEQAGYRRTTPFGNYVHSTQSICFEKRLSESLGSNKIN